MDRELVWAARPSLRLIEFDGDARGTVLVGVDYRTSRWVLGSAKDPEVLESKHPSESVDAGQGRSRSLGETARRGPGDGEPW
jgi:hypothetical protein